MKRFAAVVAIAVLAFAPRALTAQSVDSTFAVRSGAHFELQSVSGSVHIRAWNRPQIRVQAESDGARVDLDASPGGVSVRAMPRRGEGDVDFTISVPVGTPLEVHAISADVDASAVCGPVRLGSISGGVTLACATGDVEVESVSGDVSASDIRDGHTEISSTSGDVQVRQAKGSLSAHSVSGDVTLERVDGDDVGVETVSGEIGFSGPIHDNGRYRFHSHSGDVTVRPDGDLNATVDVSTFSGDLESDWPITITPGPGRRMHGQDWEFTVGNGGARLTLGSFSGTIYLRRGSSPRRED
ncbi:MAG TPA: DUF4097 family beta strand repeat-containing protein [Gemmatimonadales bacterium]|nr:DUF4097 family beta strand repeat-containing protein [Gemmatimonadales bacterium]